MKKSLLVLLIFLTGCSSTDKKPLKQPLVYERPEHPFSNSTNDVWYQVNCDTYNFASNKLHPAPVTTVRLSQVEDENSLLEVYFEVGTNRFPDLDSKLNQNNKKMIEDNKDYIVTQKIKNFVYLENTPFFILSEDNDLDVKKELPTFLINNDPTIKDGYLSEQAALDSLITKSKSIITIENKYIHQHAKLHFISKNGDIRNISPAKIAQMIEYGIADYRIPPNEPSRKGTTQSARDIFNPEQFKDYLETTYGILPQNDYYLITDVTQYIMENGAILEELFEVETEDYIAYVYQNTTSLNEKGEDWERRIAEFTKHRYNGERTRDRFVENLKSR